VLISLDSLFCIHWFSVPLVMLSFGIVVHVQYPEIEIFVSILLFIKNAQCYI